MPITTAGGRVTGVVFRLAFIGLAPETRRGKTHTCHTHTNRGGVRKKYEGNLEAESGGVLLEPEPITGARPVIRESLRECSHQNMPNLSQEDKKNKEIKK
jgi:hypothetical protein